MTERPWVQGPWIAEGPARNRIVWRDDVNRICFMAHSNGRDPERDIATSNLVAAAPDLYEALAEIVALSDRKHDAWDRAHAALAKARGDTT